LLVDIPSRAGYLYKKYKNKYSKLIQGPDWEEEELEELGPSLRKEILSLQVRKRTILLKLAVLERVREY
jgi:hypothetical protein